MNKSYESYTPTELLNDESFLRWRLYPTKDDHLFWETFLQNHPDKKDEIEEAIRILKTLRINNFSISSEEKMDLFESLQKSITEKKQNKNKYIRYSISIAAGIVLLIGLSNYLFFTQTDSYINIAETTNSNLSAIQHNTKDIQLILNGQNVMSFDNDADINVTADGNLVINSGNKVMAAKNIATDQPSFNKLIVPKGKRSSLTLSDGTKVWVNSGSILEFPDRFNDKIREIRIEGEMYIEVQKNMNHPFIVNTPSFSVRVLGTRFNISAYKEEAKHSVVLVEGKVNVELKTQTIALSPDEMLSINDQGVEKEKVNVYNYISWKDGMLQYRSEPLSQILNQLSRYYDINVECEPLIKDIKCTGKLVLFDNVEDVFRTISHTLPVRYEITGGKVIISKK